MPNAPRQHNPKPSQARREYEARRGSASDRGYDWSWTKENKNWIAMEVANSADPFCRYCRRNRIEMRDHALPPSRFHKVGTPAYKRMFDEPLNYIGCCKSCNSLKQDSLPHELHQNRSLSWMYDELKQFLAARGCYVQIGPSEWELRIEIEDDGYSRSAALWD